MVHWGVYTGADAKPMRCMLHSTMIHAHVTYFESQKLQLAQLNIPLGGPDPKQHALDAFRECPVKGGIHTNARHTPHSTGIMRIRANDLEQMVHFCFRSSVSSAVLPAWR